MESVVFERLYNLKLQTGSGTFKCVEPKHSIKRKVMGISQQTCWAHICSFEVHLIEGSPVNWSLGRSCEKGKLLNQAASMCGSVSHW